MLNYGQLGYYFDPINGYNCTGRCPQLESSDHNPGSMCCIGEWLRIPVMVSAALMAIVQMAKLFQEGSAMCSLTFWIGRPEEFTHFLAIFLIVADQFKFSLEAHRIVTAFLVMASCRIMMHTIARDPDIAIFVEMVTKIQGQLFKFLISYIWIFAGWIVAFYITLGEHEMTDNNHYNSFHDIG